MDIPVQDPVDQKLPLQDMTIVQQHLHRFDRASRLQKPWADENVKCTNYLEGNQWDPKDEAQLIAEGRPKLTINKLKRLMFLCMGYQRQNRFDPVVKPDNDPLADDKIAELLSHTVKNILDANKFAWLESTIFQDGMTGGRGYYDIRMDFKKSLMGDICLVDWDPGAVYPDPDANRYDPDSWNYVFTSSWASQETILTLFGLEAWDKTQNLPNGTQFSMMSNEAGNDDVTPVRMFGLYGWFNGDAADRFPEAIGSNLVASDYYDKGQKLIRIIEQQHMKLKRVRYFVDVVTGRMTEVNPVWDAARIQAVLDWATAQGAEIVMTSRVEKRVRWTITAGDVLLYDDWSPYRHFTIVPFFPYFRRGKTRGLLADLLDPQNEINKRRSAQIHIIGTTANSGWWYQEGALDPEEEENLKANGAAPGFIGKYRAGAEKPERIEPGVPPMAMERLEKLSNEDLHEVSGINESALGEQDNAAQSGVAISNRQKQTVVALEPYLDNLALSRTLVGERIIDIVQDFYTEQRFIRALGIDEQPTELILNEINAAGQIVNDITVGKYRFSVQSVPATETFMARQFAEMLEMVKAGIIPLPLAQVELIKLSTIPNKAAIIAKLQAMLLAGVQPPAEKGESTAAPPSGALAPPTG